MDDDPSKFQIELLSCPEHPMVEPNEAKRDSDRRAAEFGFDGKLARLHSMPDGAESNSLIYSILKFMFGHDSSKETKEPGASSEHK